MIVRHNFCCVPHDIFLYSVMMNHTAKHCIRKIITPILKSPKNKGERKRIDSGCKTVSSRSMCHSAWLTSPEVSSKHDIEGSLDDSTSHDVEASPDDSTSHDAEYSALLDHVNTACDEVISRFRSINHQRALDIVSYRAETGKFSSLSDIIKVKNIGAKTLTKLMEEYRNNGFQFPDPGKQQPNKKYKLDRKLIFPWFNVSEIPESAVAFCIQLDAIYWARMTSDFIVTDWQCTELGDLFMRKYNHVTHTNKLWKLLNDIPKGSVYLTQESNFIPPTKTLTSMTLNKARLDCLITLCLNLRHHGDISSPHPPEQKVYKIKTPEIAKYFSLYVGSEKVSSQNIAMDIVKERRDNCYVHVPYELKESFLSSKRAIREQLSDCLLDLTMLYELLYQQQADYDNVTHDSGHVVHDNS